MARTYQVRSFWGAEQGEEEETHGVLLALNGEVRFPVSTGFGPGARLRAQEIGERWVREGRFADYQARD